MGVARKDVRHVAPIARDPDRIIQTAHGDNAAGCGADVQSDLDVRRVRAGERDATQRQRDRLPLQRVDNRGDRGGIGAEDRPRIGRLEEAHRSLGTSSIQRVVFVPRDNEHRPRPVNPQPALLGPDV